MAPAKHSKRLWREQWKRKHNWTASELAKLCLGWDPGSDVLPDPAAYNKALGDIRRAVQAKALPTLELLWPPSGAERMYGSDPLCTPRAGAAWAAQEYPETFAYAGDAWWDDNEPKAPGGAQVPGIAPEVVMRRRGVVKTYCYEQGIKRGELAKRIAISADTLRAIVREDSARYTTDARNKLLKQLGVSPESWNSA